MTNEKQEVIGPRSRKQKMFLDSDANVTIFGGSAGSSKSYSGIMGFLHYIKYKNFRGLITRRTTPQLKGSGGILDTSMQLFKKVDPKVRWKSQDNKFVFSSGAEIHLRHFEYMKDKDNYQGLQVNRILVDEGAQFEEGMVTYLMSRLRNPSCPEVKPHICIATNPDKNSFLRNWLDWWIDENGYPIENRCGMKRWFINKDNQMLFADTPEELIEKYSSPSFKVIPMSMSFINATILDNPTLMEIQPDYVAFLQGLPRVERMRLYEGNWDVTEEASGYWKKDWCEMIDMPPLNTVKKVRAWDISGTVQSELNPSPDYTAGVLMSKDKYGNVYVEDVIRFQARHGEVYERMLATARQDGEDVMISVPQDPGAAGLQYAQTIIRDLASEGFYARAKKANKSKVQRFAPFCAASSAGAVKIVKADWNDFYFAELENFDGNRKNKDDMVDASADSYVWLCSGVEIPVFSLPDISGESRFNNIFPNR